ncbi:MAG: DNRLRE domain-containing protein [Candidatus Edwardsbacteria bacterium]
MQRFIFAFFFIIGLTQSIRGATWVQTTQSDFESGIGINVDTRISPDDVTLLKFAGIDQYQLAIQNTNNIFDVNWAAQTFLNTKSGYVTKISIYCQKVGSPPNPLYLGIRDCLGTDLPGTTVYATAQRSDITTSIGEYDFSFPTPPYLLANTKYSFVVYTTGGDAGNCYQVYYWNADIYPNGRRCTSNNGGSSWTGTATDFGFKVYNSSATLQIFQPGPTLGKDAYVDQNNPTTNYGTNVALSVERRTNRIRRSYLEFDISSLPTIGAVDSAFLNLYQNAQAAANNLTIQCRRVTSSWDESTITWNLQPTFTATVTDSITTNSNGWKRWTTSEYVQGWYQNTYPNYGFLLISSPEGGTATNYRKNFRSSNFNNNEARWRFHPYLQVYFQAFVDSGNLISSTFDANQWGEPRWCKFFFNATIPPGTEVKFQIASNEDNATWNFVGPDGTPATFYTTTNTPIWSGHYGDRYIKYKAYLKTTTNATPVLHDVTILYFKDYYVEELTGDDLTNFGRADSPFKTIQRAIELMVGSDGCIVRNGNYPGENKITDIQTGSAEYPTFFRNEIGQTPVIDGLGLTYGFLDSLGNYVEISGFTINDAIVGIYYYGTSDILCQNNVISVPDGGYGILFESSSQSRIINNRISPGAGATWPFEGIWVYNATNVRVSGNDVRNMNDCGLLLELSSNCGFYQNLSVNNMFGIDVITSSACSLYNNTFDLNLDAGIHANQLSGTIYTVNNNLTNNKYGFGWCDGAGYISSDYNDVWNSTVNNYTYGTGGYTVTPGVSDISADPLYTPTYYLSAGSSCIDAGTDVGLPYIGLAPDIGAFESAKKGKPKQRLSFQTKSVWGDDVRLTNDSFASYLSWNNGKVMVQEDSILGIVFYDNRDSNYEVYFLRSWDKGEDWEPETRVTYDALPSIFPVIAGAQGKFFLVWCQEISGSYNLFFKYSTDFGSTWSSDTSLTNLTTDCGSPSLAVFGDTLHLVFHNNRTGNYEIFYKRSVNGGTTWSPDTQLTNNPASSYFPSLTVTGDTLHLVWFDERDANFEIYYKRSTDGGLTWSSDIRITLNDSVSAYPSIVAGGNNVHLFWHENRLGNYDIYYAKSIDGGVSFNPEVNLTQTLLQCYFPSVTISGSYLHLVYREGDEIFYKYSTDYGQNWGSPLRISSAEGISEYAAIAARADSVYIVWFDERDGNPEIYFKKNVADTATTMVEETSVHSSKFIVHSKLYQNQPNPFSSQTAIRYSLSAMSHEPRAISHVSLKIYNIAGQLVKTLVDEQRIANSEQRVIWDGTDESGKLVARGVYFYRLQVGDFSDTKKMILLR